MAAGRTTRMARELAHEILKPIGQDLHTLKAESRENMEHHLRKVVERGQEDQLIAQQANNRRDEAYDDRSKFHQKRFGR